jgi:hypothetical protein
MLLQTNSYIVPKERRAEHARLMRRFRQILHNLGCDNFEIYEQVGSNWSNTETSGRFVQIMRFRDRKHQLAVQNAERSDPAAQQLIAEFCELVNYPYQQQQGQFAVGFYSSVLPVAPGHSAADPTGEAAAMPVEMPHDETEGTAAEILEDEVASTEGAATTEEAPAEQEAFAPEAEAEAEVEPESAPEGGLVGEPFVNDEPEPSETEMEADVEIDTQGPVSEESTEAQAEEAAPRPIPAADADLDADLDIPDDELARLADELAADDVLDPGHAHGQGGHRHGENGHS